MLDLLNDLTLDFVWIIHNFQDKMVDLKFRVLPTLGTTVATTMEDWAELSICISSDNGAYSSVIGQSKDTIWTLIIGEWTKYKASEAYEASLIPLFTYIDTVGIK